MIRHARIALPGLLLIPLFLVCTDTPQAEAAEAGAFAPTVPFLEMGKIDGQTAVWNRPGVKEELSGEALSGMLTRLVFHKDKKQGWPGTDKDFVGQNRLVLKVADNAPATAVQEVLATAAAGFVSIHVGSEAMKSSKAGDTNPPGSYIDMKPFIGARPLRQLALRLVPRLEDGRYTFSLRQGTKSSEVLAARIDAADLAGLSSADLAKTTTSIRDSLDAWVTGVDRSTQQIDVIHITYDASREQAWRVVAIACRAANALNAARVKAKKRKLELVLSASTPRPPRADLGGRGAFAFRRARGNGSRGGLRERPKAALNWLRDHQHFTGYWSATNFSADSKRKDVKKTYNIDFKNEGLPKGEIGWKETTDVGLTGLALLAFAAGGYDHKTGPYKETCRRAILYLRKVQQNNGCFGPQEGDHFVYNHAICTMAMAEIYGLTRERDLVLKPLTDRAIQFILQAQNPGRGWRYGVPRTNDSSVTGWMVLALNSCEMAGLKFDSKGAFAGAADWFDTATIDVKGSPKVGYDSPGSKNARLSAATDYWNNPTMDAIYIAAMLFSGKAGLSDKTIKKLAKICVKEEYLPMWEHLKIDYYYWYYASLALYQVGGRVWSTWEKAMSKTLLDHQRGYHAKDVAKGLTNAESLDEHGSWDPVGAWGSAGGRVYATAINCLTLQVWTRYQRIKK